jgi:hypothetical protein
MLITYEPDSKQQSSYLAVGVMLEIRRESDEKILSHSPGKYFLFLALVLPLAVFVGCC